MTLRVRGISYEGHGAPPRPATINPDAIAVARDRTALLVDGKPYYELTCAGSRPFMFVPLDPDEDKILRHALHLDDAPGSVAPPVVAAIVAQLRAAADKLLAVRAGITDYASTTLHNEANRIAAEHPDAEAWATKLVRAALADRELFAQHVYAQSAPSSGKARAEEQIEQSIAAIVRRCMGGGA